jgi:GNAT superfamily N-acetyltransferase
MTADVLPLSTAHLLAVTSLLSEAFMSDAGMRALCYDTTEAHYRQCLSAWFLSTLRLQLATCQPAWIIIVDDMIVGVALLRSRRTRFAFYPWLRWVLAVGRHCGWGTVWRTACHERQRAVYRPAKSHAVLEFIAVHRAYQGKGYAALLLDLVQQWSKTQAFLGGVWLETTRLRNIAFFEHFGYIVTGQMPFEQGTAFFLFRACD